MVSQREPMNPDNALRLFKVFSSYYADQSEVEENALGYPNNANFGNWVPEKLRNITFIHVGDPFTSNYTAPNVLALEREVVQWGMNLWQVSNPADYWGYVTSGSSESIIQALYSAREALPDATLFFSADAHYAVPKAGHLLGIKNVVEVASNDRGEIDLADFSDRLAEHTGRNVMLVLTCGTTLHQGHDNIAGAIQVLDDAGVSTEKRYIHVDAALGGMVVPFDDTASEDIRPSFRHAVDSISTSGHKMIGTCMPCGVFVANKRYRDGTSRGAEIVSNEDPTIACSRNGQAVLAIWARLFGHGVEGYKNDVQRCFKLAQDMTEQLQNKGIPATRNKSSITVCFPKPSPKIVGQYHLACVGKFAHVVVMPSVTREILDRFLKEYTAWWQKSGHNAIVTERIELSKIGA